MQPGDTIKPGATQPDAPTETPAPASSDQAAATTPAADPISQSAWQYHQEGPTAEEQFGGDPGAMPMPDTRSASWTASEYVAHHKNAGWFMLLILATIAASGLIYLVTDEFISAVVIGIVGLAFGIFAARPPQTLDYVIDEAGLHIGQKSYPYHIFRSFSVLDEGVMPSILLMPMQRFNLPITIYYDPKDEETIVTVLGSHLPHEPREVSAIDRFMSKIRF